MLVHEIEHLLEVGVDAERLDPIPANPMRDFRSWCERVGIEAAREHQQSGSEYDDLGPRRRVRRCVKVETHWFEEPPENDGNAVELIQ